MQINCCHAKNLKFFAVSLDDVDEMQHVVFVERRVLKHESEEVGLRFERLVCDHHASLLHHFLFDRGGHFVQLLVEALVARRASEPFGDVPEADVGALGFGHELEAFAAIHQRREVLRLRKDRVHVLLETLRSLRPPHVPEFVDVGASAALNVLVSSVVLRVVEFIFLE